MVVEVGWSHKVCITEIIQTSTGPIGSVEVSILYGLVLTHRISIAEVPLYIIQTSAGPIGSV